MSSGPGSIQILILNHLSHNPTLFNKLLWDLAPLRDGISHNGNYGFLPKGELKRSYVESFRRAVTKLEDNGRITAKKRKFVDLNEAIEGLPFITTSLQLNILRRKVQSDILNYLLVENPRATNIDYERFTVSVIKETDPETFNILRMEWKIIENLILLQMCGDKEYVDHWLNILIRGRTLFTKRKLDFGMQLHTLHRLIIEKDELLRSSEIDNALTKLFNTLSSYESWEIGKIKTIVYKMLKISTTSSSSSLTDESKDYLFKKYEAEIKSLPGHNEPPAVNRRCGITSISAITRRSYDPILDKLIDRQLFKYHKYISI